MSRLRTWAADLLFGPETAARLVVVQIGLSVLVGYRILNPQYPALAELPPALMDPVPIVWWLDSMPSVEVIIGIQVVGVAAALAAALRRRPRLAFAVAWLCLLVLAGLRSSRGKVQHNELLLLWASAPFLFAPVVQDVREAVARRRYGWPIRTAIVITALIYFFAGLHKLWRSGIDWVLGDNMQYLMLWGPSIGEAAWQDLGTWVGEHTLMAKAAGAFIVGFEITFLVVLVLPRLRPLYAVGAVFLHATTWLVLGLDYTAWALTVLLLLIDWPAVVARYRARRGTVTGSPPAVRRQPDQG